MNSVVKLQRAARKWHSNVSTILFGFFFIIAITAILLGWKDMFASKIYTSPKKQKTVNTIKEWLPLDSLQMLATLNLKNKVADVQDIKITTLNANIDKGVVRFTFKNQFNVILNAKTGDLISVEKKATDLFIRIHDGEILDDMIHSKGGVFKTTYTTLMGTALFFLTVSGFWLRFGPKKSTIIKKRHKENLIN